jgi:hypothetical protein
MTKPFIDAKTKETDERPFDLLDTIKRRQPAAKGVGADVGRSSNSPAVRGD